MITQGPQVTLGFRLGVALSVVWGERVPYQDVSPPWEPRVFSVFPLWTCSTASCGSSSAGFSDEPLLLSHMRAGLLRGPWLDTLALLGAQ